MNPVKWKPIALYVYKYGVDKADFYSASQYMWDANAAYVIEVRSIDGKERYEYYGLPYKIVYAAESDEHED